MGTTTLQFVRPPYFFFFGRKFSPPAKMNAFLPIFSMACLVMVSNGQFFNPGFMGMPRPPYPAFQPSLTRPNPVNPNPVNPVNVDSDTRAEEATTANPTEASSEDQSINTESIKQVADSIENSCVTICEKTKRKTYRYEVDFVFPLMEIARIIIDCPKWCSTAKGAFESGVFNLEKMSQQMN